MNARVEQRKVIFRNVAVPDAVEDSNEFRIALPEHMAEFDANRSRAFSQCRHRKEERPAVIFSEIGRHFGFLYNRRQLMQITEHDEPHPAKRFARPPAI